MTAIMKAMGEGGNGCSLFMEGYTYNLAPGAEYSLEHDLFLSDLA